MNTRPALMGGVKQFCSKRLKADQELGDLTADISGLDAQKRQLQEQIRSYMNSQRLTNVQIPTPQGLLQAKMKNAHTYELPTPDLLQRLHIDWSRLQKVDFDNSGAMHDTITYIFKNLQEARRITRKVLEVKECGKRNRKKLQQITDSALVNTVGKCFALSEQTKTLRRKRKRICSTQDEDYEQTLEFLRQNKLKAQTFNLKSENGQPARRLLVRRVQAGNAKSLSGRDLKALIQQTLEESSRKLRRANSNADLKGVFTQRLMDLIYTHLQDKKSSRERLIYEIA